MHFINYLEQKLEKSSFSRIDADVIDKLIQKEDSMPSRFSEEEQNKLKDLFEKSINKDVFTLTLENMQETDLPIYITKPEFLRRWSDMQKMTGEMGMYGMDMEKANMSVNANHPLISELLNEKDEARAENLSKQLIDLAMLSQQMLKGEALSNFIKRSIDIMK